jgi:uncharacterized protein YjbI with pentapeptide repeats
MAEFKLLPDDIRAQLDEHERLVADMRRTGRNLTKEDPIFLNLENVDLRGCDLSGRDLSYIYFKGAHLEGANLTGSNLLGSNCEGAWFTDAILDGANLYRTNLRNAGLLDAKLNGVNFSDAITDDRTTVDNAAITEIAHSEKKSHYYLRPNKDGSLTEFRAIPKSILERLEEHATYIEQGSTSTPKEAFPQRFENEDLSRLDLSGRDFTGMHFEAANFERSDLSRAICHRTHFEKANLQWARLQGTELYSTHLNNADMRNAILYDAKLSDAGFAGANLEGAMLVDPNRDPNNQNLITFYSIASARVPDGGGKLKGGAFAGAILKGVDLRGLDLVEKDLRGADLRGANLTGMDLTGADLTGADLRCAILDGAKLNETILVRAKMQGASLVGTSMMEANVDYANFENVDLTKLIASEGYEIPAQLRQERESQLREQEANKMPRFSRDTPKVEIARPGSATEFEAETAVYNRAMEQARALVEEAKRRETIDGALITVAWKKGVGGPSR